MRKNVIMVLAAHTDDGELGCGGSIARFTEEGKEVYYVAFSTAGALEPFTSECVKKEARSALAVLGIPENRIILYNYEIRKLGYSRQNILDDLIMLKKEIDPESIFLPCGHDLHQDHNTVHNEGLRAFKECTILGYELFWNNITFHSRHFIPLTEDQIQKKIASLRCYKSQEHRHYVDDEFIRGLARARGVQIVKRYAEAFDVIRWVLM